MDLPLKLGDTRNYILSSCYLRPNGPLFCFLSSSLQPGSSAYLPSDWLLYSLGDWFTRSHLSMWLTPLSAAPPRRAELASKYKQYQSHSQHSVLFMSYAYIPMYVPVYVCMHTFKSRCHVREKYICFSVSVLFCLVQWVASIFLQMP